MTDREGQLVDDPSHELDGDVRGAGDRHAKAGEVGSAPVGWSRIDW